MATVKSLYANENHRRKLRFGGASVDFLFLVLLLVLLAIGLIMLYSASFAQSEFDSGYTVSTLYLRKQAASCVVGLIAMFFLSKIPCSFWLKMAWPLYWLSILLLLSVLV